jgi:hypothetical protein
MVTARHSLAPWEQDLIADGVAQSDKSRVPLFNATVSLACSAVVKDMTETDFRNILQDGVKTPSGRAAKLWHQITHRRNKKLAWEKIDYFLSKAWEWAKGNVAKGKLPNRKREKDILKLAETAHEAIPHLGLGTNQAKVLTHIANETTRKKFLHVTTPARGVAKDCSISVKGAYEALISLRDKGLIVCRERGIGKKGSRRAAIYRLSDLRHANAPAQGSPTVPPENPSDQRNSNSITYLLGPTNPAQGAGGFKKTYYPPGGLGTEGVSTGTDTLAGGAK